MKTSSFKNRRKGGSFLSKRKFKAIAILLVSLVLVVSVSCVSSLSVSAYTLKTYSLTVQDFINLVDNGRGYFYQAGDDNNGGYNSVHLPINLSSSNFKLYPLNISIEEFYQLPYVAIYPDFMSGIHGNDFGYSSFVFNIGDTNSVWDMYSSSDLDDCRYISLYFDVFFGFAELENNTLESLDDYYSVLSEFPSRYIYPAIQICAPDGYCNIYEFGDTLPNNSSIIKNTGEVCCYYTFDIRFTPDQIKRYTPGTTFEFMFDWDGIPDSSYELIFGFDTNNCFYEFTKNYTVNSGVEEPPGNSGIYDDFQSGVLNENQQMIDDLREKMNISSNPDSLGLDNSFINSLSESYSGLTRSFRNSAFYSFLTTLCIPSVSIAVLGFVLYGKSK